MNNISIRGAAGEVRWSYHRAASLGAWTLTPGSAASTLTASVVSLDTFKVSQQPLTFVVPRPTGRVWRWPVLSLQISGTEMTATLGPQE